MLFSSFAFLALFLPPTVLAYRVLRHFGLVRPAQIFLILATLAFYGWSEARFLPLLLASIAGNWAITRAMAKYPPQRKAFFVTGIALNLAVLFGYKYLGFFSETLRAIGIAVPSVSVSAFPPGLSFFTLQQVMLLVDCYEGLAVAGTLLSHASFVAFFPYILLGPLSRARRMIPQLTGGEVSVRAGGWTLLVFGLAKKVIIADTLATLVNAGYTNGSDWSTAEAWLFSVAYSLQLYFDFSGYSDMAMGAARLLGIEIPQNFNAPYRARTVTEFWQRWHMSLSAFITAYLFTPLLRTMGRATQGKAAVASFTAMLIAGLWHGPSWTFIAFGGMHGTALVVNQYWKRTKRKLSPTLAVLCTLLFCNAAFVVFRAPSMSVALDHLLSLAPFRGASLAHLESMSATASLAPWLLVITAAAAMSYVGPTATESSTTQKSPRLHMAALFVLSVVSAVMVTSGSEGQFVYAQF